MFFYSSFSLLVPCWQCPWSVGSPFSSPPICGDRGSEQRSEQGRSTKRASFRYASTNGVHDVVASHARLDTIALVSRSQTFSSKSLAMRSSLKPKFASHVPSSHYIICKQKHTTKFKTTKFNSEGLFQLFTKISTNENNPLYGNNFLNTIHNIVTTVHTYYSMSLRATRLVPTELRDRDNIIA